VNTAVVIAGGAALDPDTLEELPDSSLVIAADSGLDRAMELGLAVDLVVGDLDSVSSPALAAYAHVPREEHPRDKDATDLDLALRAADRAGAQRIVVVGGHGGRLDHLLANATLLSSPRFAHLDIEWVAGRARVRVVHDAVELHGSVGDVVSLVPFGGPVRGVSTTGLRWPLDDEDLPYGSTRGVSNEFARPVANVRIRSGTLLAIKPAALPS